MEYSDEELKTWLTFYGVSISSRDRQVRFVEDMRTRYGFTTNEQLALWRELAPLSLDAWPPALQAYFDQHASDAEKWTHTLNGKRRDEVGALILERYPWCIDSSAMDRYMADIDGAHRVLAAWIIQQSPDEPP